MQVGSHLESQLSTSTWMLVIFRNRKICTLKQLIHRKHQQHNPCVIPALVRIQRPCWWSRSVSWETLKIMFYINVNLSPLQTIETKALSWKDTFFKQKLWKLHQTWVQTSPVFLGLWYWGEQIQETGHREKLFPCYSQFYFSHAEFSSSL